MKLKFLWIEDGAIADYQTMLGPVFVSGKYDPVIALNVADGIRQLRQSRFDAVIVDIRLPPGESSEWARLYDESRQNKATARLGLKVLYCLLGPGEEDIRIEGMPDWVKPDRFGVLTVENKSELQEDLDRLGIRVYRQKTARTPNNVLIDMIEEIKRQMQTE